VISLSSFNSFASLRLCENKKNKAPRNSVGQAAKPPRPFYPRQSQQSLFQPYFHRISYLFHEAKRSLFLFYFHRIPYLFHAAKRSLFQPYFHRISYLFYAAKRSLFQLYFPRLSYLFHAACLPQAGEAESISILFPLYFQFCTL
jgi:hypothetical protein